MARFDDYHRTVVGYHGTTLSAALRVVTRIETFRPSRRDFDWLGVGTYFWEYAPQQALRFAAIRQRQLRRKANRTPEEARRADEPLAVVACMIRLGYCLDLLEPDHVDYLRSVYADYQESMVMSGTTPPRNNRKYRRLDCAVFEYAYQALQDSESISNVETSRGVYVPTGGQRRLWEGSWVSRDAHIQVCVREPKNLLGCWLHSPSSLGVNDVHEALQDAPLADEPGHPQGEAGI